MQGLIRVFTINRKVNDDTEKMWKERHDSKYCHVINKVVLDGLQGLLGQVSFAIIFCFRFDGFLVIRAGLF